MRTQPLDIKLGLDVLLSSRPNVLVAEDVRGSTSVCETVPRLSTDEGRTTATGGIDGQRVIERPWQVVAGNVTGPFVKSKHGYEYILVFEDLFTRWVECVPIRKANARTILNEFLERIVLRFGTPKVFLSDNGTEFKNKAVDEYLEGIGIYHSTAPPYHP